MNKNKLIYILVDDLGFGKAIRTKLAQRNFNNVIHFSDEKKCLANIARKPGALIVDDQLKNMTGLQFIQKAKTVYPNFFVILLSGGCNDFTAVKDERFLLYVDKFIIKGMNDLLELIDALVHFRTIKNKTFI